MAGWLLSCEAEFILLFLVSVFKVPEGEGDGEGERPGERKAGAKGVREERKGR